MAKINANNIAANLLLNDKFMHVNRHKQTYKLNLNL